VRGADEILSSGKFILMSFVDATGLSMRSVSRTTFADHIAGGSVEHREASVR
jgi:hypothetical protein